MHKAHYSFLYFNKRTTYFLDITKDPMTFRKVMRIVRLYSQNLEQLLYSERMCCTTNPLQNSDSGESDIYFSTLNSS